MVDPIFRMHPSYQRIRNLLRLAVGDGISPNIVGQGRAVVILEQRDRRE